MTLSGMLPESVEDSLNTLPNTLRHMPESVEGSPFVVRAHLHSVRQTPY
jgi:hypothetical protein